MVRMPNWIGDAVMATPALAAIRATFSEARVTVVANPLVAELFTFHPDCDQVIRFDKKNSHSGVAGFWRFCCELRRERFDLAILLQNAFEAAAMALLTGIPSRAGYRTDGRGMLLTHGVPAVDKKHGLHHVDYYLQMLSGLGIEGGDDRLSLALSAEEEKGASVLLGTGPWIAVNPGASYGAAKRWIPERFAAVADSLAAEFGVQIVLTGGPGETEIGRDIEQAMQRTPLNLIGRTSVRELMAILNHCRLVVTNDSGPMHIAAAFGVPIVAVFGPTDHTTTSPRTDNCLIVRVPVDCAPCLLRECPIDHRCMTGITADMVLAAARELWERAR
ncbi:lipopolysaccharide heptosyltransferase II [Malonomonas rubra]|uniref:lipopolysaccharide heptosyltransferase II n=1 Tax=Malonomonas rubra TaxID=57040 RepID=UPI0026F12727|nr:lipopolysaccharide heptosyltransferase II [Malonomonas rubra]